MNKELESKIVSGTVYETDLDLIKQYKYGDLYINGGGDKEIYILEKQQINWLVPYVVELARGGYTICDWDLEKTPEEILAKVWGEIGK